MYLQHLTGFTGSELGPEIGHKESHVIMTENQGYTMLLPQNYLPAVTDY